MGKVRPCQLRREGNRKLCVTQRFVFLIALEQVEREINVRREVCRLYFDRRLQQFDGTLELSRFAVCTCQVV